MKQFAQKQDDNGDFVRVESPNWGDEEYDRQKQQELDRPERPPGLIRERRKSMGMLYDVYYRDSAAMDRDTPLPLASGDIKYVTNTNWDRHILTPIRMQDGSWEWGATVTLGLYPPVGVSVISPEGQASTRSALAAMRLVSAQLENAWGPVARVTMLEDDVQHNRSTLHSTPGWTIR